MAVPIRIVALAECATILVVGHRGIVNAMRGAEVHATRDGHLRLCHVCPGKNEPRGYPRGPKKWNEEGFIKPKGKREALTIPSAFPRTGGMTSV